MKKYTIWIVLGVLVLIVIMGYNGLVGSREAVNKAWANVEASYQRRIDLFDNLVAAVQASANFEKSTLVEVTTARQNISKTQIDPNNITPEKLKEYEAAQAQYGNAMSRLLVVVERYPELKTVEAYRELQAQIEGTENRINEMRRQFNEAAQTYNTSRSKFPRVIIANLFGFKERAYFESDKGAEKAPKIRDSFHDSL